MKIDILLFTQTMYSLLNSSLSLQSALNICGEIISGKKEQKFLKEIHKGVNEGKKLATVLSESKEIFSPLYLSLISIGEESGMLSEVFERLSSYMQNKKKLNQKIFQSLAYPAIVFITAIAVIFVLIFFVMPRLESIFMAFTESSEMINQQLIKMKNSFFVGSLIILILFLIGILLIIFHKTNYKVAFVLDSFVLKIPIIGKTIMSFQMYDFSFAMKLFSSAYYPLVPSLLQSGNVLKNKRVKIAIESVCKSIIGGNSVGDAFENENIFPKYLIVWIKLAEKNGKTAEVFNQICDYYSSGTENILSGVITLVEPIFILITGTIIISIITKFVIPIFTLLGGL